MSAVLLEAKHISKRYDDVAVVDSVSLQVEADRTLTIIGPNGAGKTTLLKLLLGLQAPDAGRVQRKPGLRIGYMPQKLHVDSTFVISAGRFLQLASKDRQRCLDAMTLTGVEHLFDRPLHSLSGGETQRVLLARAVLREPELLVLDEPVQGVDVAGQQALYSLIRDLKEQFGCGVLMVSHDLHTVMASTDEVLCLNHHICCQGEPDHVSRQPEFLSLFGDQLAPYTHRHDHHHDLDGNPVPADGCHHD